MINERKTKEQKKVYVKRLSGTRPMDFGNNAYLKLLI